MKDRGLHELSTDAERADALLWSRRGFLAGSALVAVQRALQLSMPFARFLPAGYIPLALAQAAPDTVIVDKPGLRVLSDRPLNVETPAHLLDDAVTPAERLFVRNNGLVPLNVDPAGWSLTISGEAVKAPRRFGLDELKHSFAHHTYQLQLECGGNGRAEYRPRVPGNQWTTGGVGCPEWTGVRVRDVLAVCGVADNAAYLGFKGADRHLSGDPNKAVISRGVPMAKANQDESLLAFAMNGAPIPAIHGAPLRLVCAGWPGSVSGKWLTDLYVRDRVHDGAKMEGSSYRVPCQPVAPGSTVADEQLCIIESMPVKSLITTPASGVTVAAGQPIALRGHAWAGELNVAAMAVSIDFGATWHQAALDQPRNRLAWQQWHASVTLPQPGYYEIWARATDALGQSQPMLVPGWNPKGYINNATHRIAVQAA